MTVAIVDYGSGNLRSASKALQRAAATLADPQPILVTADPEAVRRAERIVLPGVGAFRDCRDGIAAIDGMMEALDTAVRRDGKPFLGICVGMQLMATSGREHGMTPGFGWIAGEVRRLEPADPMLKIPPCRLERAPGGAAASADRRPRHRRRRPACLFRAFLLPRSRQIGRAHV